MKLYVIKNLETNRYLTLNFREVVNVWESAKFSTSKEANEHLEVKSGYFQIIPIIQKSKTFNLEDESN